MNDNLNYPDIGFILNLCLKYQESNNSIMKYLLILILQVNMSFVAFGQKLTKPKVLAITPELNTTVNGIGFGLMVNSLHLKEDSTTSIINGLNVEIVGVGFFLPLAPSNVLIPYDSSIDQIAPVLDSLINEAKDPTPYKINGLNISLGGLAGHEVQLNGINLSGICTFTAQTKGVSIAYLFNLNKVMHGVSVGIINQTLEHKGVQIGVFNRSEKTKGIQIGLWNKNEKRSLPMFNWN